MRPVEKVLAFMHERLCEARKLSHVCCLRRDPLVPEGLRRQQVGALLFFQDLHQWPGRPRAVSSIEAERPDWPPSQKEGYTLDWDSTRLLHEDDR